MRWAFCQSETSTGHRHGSHSPQGTHSLEKKRKRACTARRWGADRRGDPFFFPSLEQSLPHVFTSVSVGNWGRTGSPCTRARPSRGGGWRGQIRRRGLLSLRVRGFLGGTRKLVRASPRAAGLPSILILARSELSNSDAQFSLSLSLERENID